MSDQEKALEIVREWEAGRGDGFPVLSNLIAEALAAAKLEGYREGIEKAANEVPTSWLDPMLTGPDKVTAGVYDCRDIEALLRAVAGRIRSLTPKGEPKNG